MADPVVTAVSADIPLSLYIHFPWCVQKCPYCDFNSHAMTQGLDEAAYIDALIADLDADLQRWPELSSKPLVSVFMGGGTPSLFSGAAIARLLQAIGQRIPLQADCEITLEANPGTVDAAHFAAYRAGGVNRLSLGVQSFDGQHLKTLGRIHSGQQAHDAVKIARSAGFDNFNLDLMHGLSEQQAAQALEDLAQAVALEPSHLSWYQLTLEPNTEYYRRPPPLPGEDDLVAIQEQGQAYLEQQGFIQYEVSAFSRSPQTRARHNLNYWGFGDYLGIGAGAHAKISLPGGEILRSWKTRHPQHYLDRRQRIALAGENPFEAGSEAIEAGARPFEFLMNALRLREGVPDDWYEARTFLSRETLEPTWSRLVESGLLLGRQHRLACTPTGFNYLNSVLSEFLVE